MKLSQRRSGSALVLALVAFLFMAGIGGAIFSLTLGGAKSTVLGSFGDGAYHIAEAGIDDTLNKMRGYLLQPLLTSADFAVIGDTVVVDGVSVNVVQGNIRGGRYFVTITPPVDTTLVQNYTIKSIGELLNMKRGITCYVVTEKVENNNKYGLFGDVYLDTGGNIKTDGYFSIKPGSDPPEKWAYEDQITGPVGGVMVANKTGHVGSNGNVDVSGSSQIYGNATPGPGGSVTGGGTVYGTTAPAPENVALTTEELSAPSSPAPISEGAVTGSRDFGKDGEDTVYTVPSVSPNGKSVVKIYGNVKLYITGDFDFSGQPTLEIMPGASLTVYQYSGSGTASLKINGGSVINTDKLPGSLTIHSNTANGTLNGNADFYGMINAPTTAIKIAGTAGLYGATIAKQIDVQGTPYFHYDESLGLKPSFKLKVNVNAVEQFVPGTDSTKAK